MDELLIVDDFGLPGRIGVVVKAFFISVNRSRWIRQPRSRHVRFALKAEK
jgi:hypothetical protein